MPEPASGPLVPRRPIGRVGQVALVVAAAAVAILSAVLLTTDLSGRSDASPGPSVIVVGRHELLDRPAPDFELETLDGQPLRLAQLRGRPVIVNFWASWCIPCREEFRLFDAARERHADEALEVVGIVYRDSPEAARAFYEAHGGSWPVAADPGEAVARRFGVLGLPITFYVDREGIVRTVSYGPPPGDVLEEQLAKIL